MVLWIDDNFDITCQTLNVSLQGNFDKTLHSLSRTVNKYLLEIFIIGNATTVPDYIYWDLFATFCENNFLFVLFLYLTYSMSLLKA